MDMDKALDQHFASVDPAYAEDEQEEEGCEHCGNDEILLRWESEVGTKGSDIVCPSCIEDMDLSVGDKLEVIQAP